MNWFDLAWYDDHAVTPKRSDTVREKVHGRTPLTGLYRLKAVRVCTRGLHTNPVSDCTLEAESNSARCGYTLELHNLCWITD